MPSMQITKIYVWISFFLMENLTFMAFCICAVVFVYRCNINQKLYENADPESVELKTVRNLAKIWTNFAKFG